MSRHLSKTMKFILNSTTTSARSGVIKDVPRLPDFEFETPCIFLYTKGGNIPYVTHEISEMITKENNALHVPLTTISNIGERIKLYDKPLADFIGMKNSLTYLTIIDPEQEQKEKQNAKGHVSLWTLNGRKQYNAESYLKLVKDSKPDMFAIISGSCTPKVKKKFEEKFEADVTIFKKCLEIFKNSNLPKNTEVLGTLPGGSDLNFREKFSKVVGESSVFGVVIDGLATNGIKAADLKIDDVKPLLEASLKHIPDEKLQIIHGCWNPKTALDLVEMGVDVLDSSYPSIIAEQGGALSFINNKKLFMEDFISEKVKTDEPTEKKPKLDSGFFISLHDSKYEKSFEPISNTCTCFACQNHTRAYIHHLLNVKELLGKMLLTIHNLHHYLTFFATIRTSVKSGQFHELVKNFDSLYS